jgi:short-subunit dehydrogenase
VREQAMAEERRWAVITGASSGIGAELARVFAPRGYSLVLAARRAERLETLAGELRAQHGVEAEVLASDLEDPVSPAKLLEEIEARGIRIHTLVNNAGFGLRGRFARLPYDEQIAMLELNVLALTKLCRLVLPGLIERRTGGILNVASTAAFQAGPNMAVYYATKAFVLSLSEALHEETNRYGVTVTALCPGPTPTEFAARANLQMTRLFKMKPMTLSAEQVAREGVDGYEAGKAIVIPGWANRIGALGAQLGPRALARKIAGRLQG